MERESGYPLAAAIVRYAEERGVPSLDVTDFRNVPGHGADARVAGQRVLVGVAGQRVLVGNRKLMAAEGVEGGSLVARRDELAGGTDRGARRGQRARGRGDRAGRRGPEDVGHGGGGAALAGYRGGHAQRGQQGDRPRIAGRLGIDTVIAEVLPRDKAAKITELQRAGNRVAMVGDGVNDAPALAQADLEVATGAGTDVAIETADVVLVRSDPLDVPIALRIGKGTLRKMRQNLGWAIGYNAVALPIAAGVFAPAFGLVLRPEIAALSMWGWSLIVAVNALLLKWLRLPEPQRRPRCRRARRASR